MKRLIIITGLLFVIALVSLTNAFATITVTPATGGTNLSSDSASNGVSPSWATLTAITIPEASNAQGKNDISAGTGVTLVLKVPAGFEFNTGQAPSISFTLGQDITSASVAVTDSTTITVTLTVSGVAGNDSFSITGLQVRPTTAGPLATARHIYRPSTGGGTAVLSGITANADGSGGEDFGQLSQTTGAFTKLQVLAPNETAAPGTVSGKAGTPSARTAGSSFNVTVNAVDAYWNVVTSINHTVALSSSDSAATLAGATALVSGTKNLSVTLKTAGSQTVTATDSVNGATGTSSALTVNPDNADKLTIQTQPSATATAGVAFAQQPVIRIEDQFGNLVSTDNSTLVKAARSAGTGTLQGTLSVAAVNGVVTFVGLNYQVAETMTIAFTKQGLTSATSQNIVVGAAGANKLGIQTQPSSAATAGTAFAQQPVIRIEDQFGNLVSSDSSSGVTAARATGTGTLQGTLTATAVNGLATFSNLSYLVAETMTVNFTSGSLTSITSANVAVSAAAFVKLQILAPGETAAPGTASGKTSTPTTQTAGSSFSVTVNSVDTYWNVVSSAHTVAITLSDPIAVPPANANLSGGSKNRTITLKTAGTQTVTASDVTDPNVTSATSSSITVIPDTTNKLGIQTQPSSTATAGVAFTQQPVIRIEDQFGNLVTTDNSTIVAAARSAGSGVLQGTLTKSAVNGLVTFTGLNHQVATTITIVFTKTGLTAVTSGNIVVSPAAASQLVFKTQPASATAGSSFVTQPVVATQDSFGNDSSVGLASNLDVTAALTAGAGPLQGTTSLNIGSSGGNGTVTFTNLRIDAAGTDKQLTASATGMTSGASSVFTVSAGALNKLQLLVPGETAAPGTASGKTGTPSAQITGTAFDVTVNSVDAFWNLVSSSHNVGFTSSDANASLPGGANLSGGTKVRTVTLNTVGAQTLTAVDNNASPLTSNTSPSITVNAGAFTKLQILLPGETAAPGSPTGKTGTPTAQTAGGSFTVTVNAVDANWNLVSSATDIVGITSSDSNAALPANNALSGGTRTFSVTAKTSGSWTVTASDISQPSITANNSPSMTVNAGVFTKLQVLAPGENAAPGTLTGKTGAPIAHTAGVSFNVTVNAVDANWNLVNTITDTVRVTSSDGNAVPPADIALTSGTKSRSVTLKTAGNQTVTVSDVTNGSITSDTSASIPVNAAAADKLGIQTQPSATATAGIAFAQQPVIRIEDQYGNLVTTDNTTIVTAARSAGNGTLQGTLTAAAAGGLATFSGLNHLEANTITILFTKTGLTGITSGNIAVGAGSFSKLQLLTPGETTAPGTSSGKTGMPDAQIGDNPFDVTVNAVDANWNLVSSVTDTVRITSSDVSAVLPANAALVGGTKILTVRLITVGTATVTAADVTDSGKSSDTSPSITVSAPPYTAATGGGAISADTTGGSYTSLTGPTYSEVATGNVGLGTIILNAPTGFVFDTGGVAPTVVITGSGVNTRNINNAVSGTAIPLTTISTTQLTFTITAKSSNGTKCSLTWQNIRVRPSAGTPLASGNITVSGTALVAGVSGSSNFGTLTEVPGAIASYSVSASTPQTAGPAFNVTVTAKDGFSNTVTTDSATEVTMTSNSGNAQFNSDGDATFAETNDHKKVLSGGIFTISTKDTVAEAITITATDANSKTGASSSITINSATANKLAFTTQPVNTTYGTTLASIVVQIQDQFGNYVSQSGTSISVTLNGGGGLGGTTSVSTSASGSATFSTLTVSQVGSKTLTASVTGLTAATSNDFTLSAKTLTPSVTLNNKLYDGTTSAATIASRSLSGIVGSDDVSLGTSGTVGLFGSKDVGSYTVSVSGLALSGTTASNYTLTTTSVSASVNITTRALMITANNDSKIYGQTKTYGAGSTALTSTGLQNGETIGSVTLTANGGTAATDAVGSYDLTPSAATGGTFAAANYSITYQKGTLTVGAAALTITANNDSKTYGQTKAYGAGSTAFTSSGLQNSETIGSVTLTASGGSAATAAVGSYDLTPSAATGGTFTASNYTITYQKGTLMVGTATLTVTANNDSKTYGQTKTYGAGSTAFTSTGLQNGETIGSVTITASGGTAATAAPGSYDLILNAATGGTFMPGNYSITYQKGTLTVGAAALTITADNDSKTYGQTKSYGAGSTAFTSTGLQNNETIGSVTLAASGGSAATAAVGSYDLTPSAATGGTFISSNYTITYQKGSLTVGAAALTITANNDTKTYGQTKTYGAGSTTFTSTGLQNGEAIGSVTLTASGGTAATDAVGGYDLTPSAATGGTFTTSNYTITYQKGTLTVSAAALTITANNDSKTYGQTKTYGTGSTAFTSSGLQNSETIGSLTLTASGGTAATAAVGNYDLTPSAATGGTFTASNYSITYQKGTLTVSAAVLTITANSDSKTYGQTKTYGAGSTAFTSTGLQNGEAIGSVTLTASGGTAATDAVGSYNLTPAAATGGTFTASNYTITYQKGTLTVSAAALTITANNDSKTYGQTKTYGAGSTAFTSSGLQNSETIGSLTLTASGGTAATAAVGSYDLTPSAATGGTFMASNYSITYRKGTLSVSAAALTITAHNDSKTYGQTKTYGVGSTAFTSSGLQNSETIGSVTLTASGGTAAADSVGSYDLIPSAATGGTFTASNYTITYQKGTLTVSAAALTITANNDSKTYGQTKTYGAGSTAFTSSGLQNSETIGSLTLTASGGAAATAAVGSYDLIPSAATGGTFTTSNYSITYQKGTLTVSAAALTITAHNDSKTYGQSKTYGVGSTAFTSSGLQNSETIGSVTITATGGTAATAAVGSYDLTPSAATGGTFTSSNYTITYQKGTLTVGAAALTITANNDSKTYGQTKTYGAGSTAFTSSGLQNSETIGSVTLSGSGGTAATDPVGSYDLTPSAAIGGTFTTSNYTITYQKGTLTVSAAALTITANNDSKTYGQTKTYGAGSTAFTSSGLQNSETIGSVTLTASGGTAATAAVGSYDLTPSTATGGTFAASNYTITYQKGTLTVSALAVVLTGGRIYDGTTSAVASILTISNKVGSDDITVTGTGVLASKNVGSQTLTSTSGALTGLTLSGADAGNYTVTGGSGSITITTLSVTLSGTRTYDGTTDASASILTVSNKAGTDVVSLSGTGTLASKHVGSRTLTSTSGALAGLSLSGSDSANYTVTGGSGSVTVTARAITVTGVTDSKTYDGGVSSTATPTITTGTLATGDTASFTQTFNSKTVGTNKTLTPAGSVSDGNSGADYAVTLVNVTTGTITAKTLTVTGITASNKVYDGTTTATLATSGAALVGVVSGDLVSLGVSGATGTFSDKNVGTGKTVTVSGLTISGADSSNYSLTQPTASANITPATATVTLGNLVQTYDGNPKSASATTSPSGLTVTFTYEGSAVPPSATGSYAVVGTIQDANYTGSGTGTLNIVPAVITAAGPSNGSYRANQNLDFTLTYSGSVTVNTTGGTPKIALTLGNATRNASYASGSGTAALVFRYTVQAGDTDTDGIASASPIDLNGGTIRDTAGNDVPLSFTVPNTTAVLVDTTAPAITLTGPSAGITRGGPVTYTVTYADANFDMSALAPDKITLNRNGTTANGAVTVTGSGTSYTLTISTITGDGTLGVSIAAGTATDKAGNTAPAMTSDTFTVDNTSPSISISAPSATVTRTASVTFTVSYVDVGGSGVNAITLESANVTLNKTGTANGTVAVTGSGTSTRTVTISGITGDGALGILLAAASATDVAGNAASSAISGTFAVDNTALNISIGAPSATVSKNGPVTYTLTYADTGGSGVNSINLAADNITLNKTGTANGTVTVSGSGSSTRTVTISGITGEGSLGITVASGTASDVAGNSSANAGPSATFAVDNTTPTISLSAPSATFASATSVSYTVSYADADGSGISAITLAAGNLTLNKTGTANGTVSVTGSGTSTRTVTISGITGDGTLGISIAAGTATDAAGNATAAAGPSTTFTVDNTTPTVSISTPSASVTAKGPVSYVVTYADANLVSIALTTAKVTLNKTGTANGSVSVTGTGNTRTVTISGLTGTGTLGISILEGTSTDSAGNSTPTAGPSATFNVDNTAPAISISAPSASFTRTGAVSYTVTYTDANFSASTLAAANVTLNRNGTANGTVAVTGSGASRTVAISDITGNGTLGISIEAGTATDQAGNSAPASAASATFVADNTAPTVTLGTPSRSYTANASVSFAVVYADSNFDTSSLSASSVTLNKTGTANGTVGVTGSGTSYSITISGITGNGTLGVSIAAATATDKAGNSAPASASSTTFTVDNVGPTVAISAPSATLATTGPVAYTITYADANFDSSTLAAANVTLNATGTAAGTISVSGSGSTRTVTISGITGDGTLGISVVAGTASDLAGNLAPAVGPSDTFTVDQTVPSVTIGAPSSTLTTSGPLTYSVTFSDPSNPAFALGAFTTSDVTLNATGTATGSVGVSGNGNTRTVTISGITGDGSLGISIRAGVVVGSSGKSSAAGGPSATCTVDNTAPVATISSPSSSFASAGPVTYTVTYTDANFNASTLATANISLNTTGTASGALSVTGNGNTRTVTISSITGNGTLGISIASGTATDQAGNTASAPAASATFTVDNTSPTVTIGAPSATFTRSGPANYTVTYSDANLSGSTLTADNVTLNRSGSANGSISVTGSGTTYTVTIASITGEGSLGIAIAAGTATDQAGNAAPASAASATFTTDNTPPTLTISAPSASITANGPITFTVTYADSNLNTTALTASQVSLNRTGTAQGTVEVSGSGTSYQVLIVGISGDGALSFTIASGTATDRAGNSALAATSETFVVDHTAPTVQISSPSAAITATGPVTYTVTYADENFNPATLTAAQVALRKTGTANGDVAVSGTGENRTVTISNITGNGTLGILITAGSATDLAGNPAPAAGPSATFTVDTTAPTLAIGAPSASFTRTDPVNFTVTYADANLDITTLTAGNITLNTTGGATGTLGVTSSGNTRTVTISNITGNGTLGISIAQGTAVDRAGNSAPAVTSATFTADNTAPTISISAPSASVADGLPVTYTVTYADANFSTSNLTADQITLNRNGSGADGIVSVTGSGTSYTVRISNITGTGTLGISIASGTASDLAGNLAPAAASVNFTVDNTAPILTIGAPSRSITANSSVTYAVTYSDANFGSSTLTAAQVALNRNGTANGTVVVTGGGTSYVITVSNITGNGALGVSIEAGTATDLAANAAPAAVSSTFSVDNTAPTIAIGAPSSTFAKSGPITYAVLYSDANFDSSTLAVGNVTLNKTGTADGTLSLTGSGTSYTVTVSSLTGEGTLGIALAAGTASDLAGNLAPAGTSATFTVDNSAPTVTISAPSASFADGLPVTYTVNYADANFSASTLTAANVTLNRTGTANGVVSVSGTGTARTVTISSITGDGSLGISIAAGTAFDLSGNLASAVGPSTAFIVDNTRPTVVISAPSSIFANSGPVTYTVTFADSNFGTSSLTASAITLNRTGTANGAVSVTGSGASFTVSIANITGDGTLSFSIAAGTATDLAGNSALGAGPSAALTVDNTRPTVAISAPSSSFARSGPVTYSVDYADANFNSSTLTAAHVTLNRTGSANGAVSVAGSAANYVVTISSITGDGTLGLSIAASTATDLAGNPVPAAGPSAIFTVDNTAPSLTIGAPSKELTSNGAVAYTVTYPDPDIDTVTLAAANIGLNKTGTANGIASVSGSGNTRIVTLSNISGDGTLGISLVAGTATDLAGNPATAAGPSATFSVDNTAPVITSATAASGTYRTDFNYTIVATESSVTFNATGLPAGLSVDTVTGVVSGKPTQTGQFNVSLSATDAAGNTGTSTLSLAIGQFLLTVSADSVSRAYGSANPAFTGTVTGVQNSDNISATYSTEATPQSAVGAYSIVPTLVDPKNKLSNYTVVINNATLTVTKAPLSAVAGNASRNYGSANPSFSGTLSGIQNSDPLTLTFSTPAVLNSSPGAYPITLAVTDSSNKLGNYTLTSTAGVLTVLDQVNFAGIAHDGYVANATVFFDANKNSVKDANEPSTQTDGQGNFNLVLGSQFDANGNGRIDPAEGSLVLTGGVDIATGLPMKTHLTAPPGSTVVNPLTTILTATLDQNPTVSVADTQAQVSAALNIPAGVNLTTYDPLAGAAAADPKASAVLTAGAKMQDTLVQVSALLGGVSSQTQSQLANTVAKVVAERISSGQANDMSQSSTVQSVIQRSAQISGATLNANVQQCSAGVIAAGNQIKDNAVAAAASPLEASREITRTQVITQGEVPALLTQIAASPSTSAEVLAPISGTALTQKVQAAPVGDVQGDDTRPGTFYFGQAVFRLQTLNPDQAKVTVYRTLGNRGQVNLTVALGGNGGTPRATVPISFADREVSKTVDLAGTLQSDGVLFNQPTVALNLVLDTGAPPLAALGSPATATLVKIAPALTAHLRDQIIIRDAPFTLEVSATAAPRPSYRWLQNGVELPAETSSSLFVRNAAPADSGVYTVIVSNPAGSVSDTATVTVVERVRILSPPLSQSVYAGESVTFEVVAEGTAPLRFAWLKNERVIPGATEAKLTLKDLKVDDAGRYAVVITNPAGSVVSPQATLSVQTYRPPTILSHLSNQTKRAGERVVFSVDVIGTPPLSFEWQKDGKTLSGVTGPILALSDVSAADTGRYSVTVRSPYGTSSSIGTLTVYSPPRLVASPQDREVLEGTDVSYTIEAIGSAPLLYAWLKNGAPIPAATGPTLVLKSVRDSDAGAYRVVVSNEFGQAASPEFQLRVVRTLPPVITAQPSNQSGLPGGSVEFAVEVSGLGPVTYQWLKDEVALPGATNRVLAIAALSTSNQGNYRVVVKNPYGAVTSSIAALILDLPSITLGKAARLADGRFSFSFPSQAGRFYVIEVSTDLRTWRTLSGITSDRSEVSFVDPNATGELRFYRVLLAP